MTFFSDVAWCVAAGSLIVALWVAVQVGRIGYRVCYPEPNRFIERCASDTHLEVVHNNLVYYQHPFAPRLSSTRDITDALGWLNDGHWHEITDLAVAYDGPEGGALETAFAAGIGRLAEYSHITVEYSDAPGDYKVYGRYHSCDPDDN
jgi:hypothetical protein